VIRTPVPSLASLPAPRLPIIVPVDVQARGWWRPRRGRSGRTCLRDGLELNGHPACVACGILTGAEHAAPDLVNGRCRDCRA